MPGRWSGRRDRQAFPGFPEHGTRAGAERLARRLDAYWHERGFTQVKHWVEPVVPDVRGRELTPREIEQRTHFAVRSNLLNGVPPGSPQSKEAQRRAG